MGTLFMGLLFIATHYYHRTLIGYLNKFLHRQIFLALFIVVSEIMLIFAAEIYKTYRLCRMYNPRCSILPNFIC